MFQTETDRSSAIYLDNQATTRSDRRVVEAMMHHLSHEYGNPHSNDHWFGWRAKQHIDTARLAVANLIKADADEIIFTSGATEANNLAILGLLNFLKEQKKSKIIVSSFEHKCVLETAIATYKFGFQTILIDPDKNGYVQPNLLRKILTKDVGLVSVMAVNNEIGTVQAISELCKESHATGAMFHCDAAQAMSFMEMDVRKLDVDMMSLSAHKMFGPKGIGALYVRQELQEDLQPIIHGGGQESGLRSGTLPTPLCVGFGVACEILSSERSEYAQVMRSLSDLFLNELSKQGIRYKLNGGREQRHPGNLNLQFLGHDAHSIIQALQPLVAVSTGSACTTGTPEPSHALRALRMSDEEAASSIRISFAPYNTAVEVKDAASHFGKVLKELSSEQLPLLAI